MGCKKRKKFGKLRDENFFTKNKNWRKKIFFNFFYSLEVYKMLHLIRDNFRLWDFFVLKFFSDYKMFRLEINRIMSNKSALINKYNNNRFKLFNKYDFINNNIKKKSINFNKINNILKDNTINNLQFFYSRNNNPSSVSALKSETFFFEIEIPKIHINYNYNKDNSVDKYFDLSMKKLLQINKLKKCFELEDLVKFSMSIVDKNEKKLKLVRKFSFFENNKYRRAKKSTTISSSVKEIRSNIKYNSFRIQQFNNERNASPSKKRTSIFRKQAEPEKQEPKKDIKLNLDKYIFNFDEDILKFIKPNENRKNEIINKNFNKFKNIKIIRTVSHKFKNRKVLTPVNAEKNENSKNLNIEFGKMKLVWTEQDLNDYEYILKEKEHQYLLDNPIYIWREYIENRIDKFKDIISDINCT